MAYYVFLFHLLCVCLLVYHAHSRSYKQFAGSLVHPQIIFAVISTFFSAEFLYVVESPELIDLAGANVAASTDDMVVCYSYYVSMFATAVAGVTVAGLFARRDGIGPYRSPERRSQPAALRMSRMLIVATLAASAPAVLVLFAHLGELLAGDMTFQLYMRESPLFFIATGILLPCFAIFLSVRKPWSLESAVVTIPTLVVLFLSGTRTNVVYGVIVILAAAVANGVRLSALWIIPIMPSLAWFLASSRYFLREGWNHYSSYADFVNSSGGYFSLFFDSGEIGMAKAFTNVVLLRDQLAWGAFDSFVGMLMFPLPRSYFTSKPLGASAYFTQELAPLRWLDTKSEITITGYGDLFLSFGLGGTLVCVFALAFVWQRGCLWAVNGPSSRAVVWVPFLIFWDFLFIRTDLYNLASFVWPFAIVVAVYHVLLIGSQKNNNDANRTPLLHAIPATRAQGTLRAKSKDNP
jgi:hypothetical protein